MAAVILCHHGEFLEDDYSRTCMAEVKVGTAIYRRDLSSILALFRLTPEPGNKFPPYKAGQYIALRREECRLTKRIVHPAGRIEYIPDLDAAGNQKRGSVTHSYSISSAPYETEQNGYLEFYIILEMQEDGKPGRLTESMFQIDPHEDNRIAYFTKIAGDFTLDKRAFGTENVVMVGTGTGLAPFAAMIKQLHFEASNGSPPGARYTLFHANRGFAELAYHEQLKEIETEHKFDFVYVPSVSRPSRDDISNPRLGKGRANNLLRSVLDMPLKEEDDLKNAKEKGEEVGRAAALLERTVKPVLPGHITKQSLLDRMDPVKSVILTCGNPRSMEDIKHIAVSRRIRFEKEDW